MGFGDSIFRKVKSDLEWSAAREASRGVQDSIRKGLKKTTVAKCPSCGAAITQPGIKFCSSCGARLVVTCPACRIDFPLNTKFCNRCGGKLQ
jgi:predicted RNA-binding Zn-ribbon protein involved in translation (DUF1610 family)